MSSRISISASLRSSRGKTVIVVSSVAGLMIGLVFIVVVVVVINSSAGEIEMWRSSSPSVEMKTSDLVGSSYILRGFLLVSLRMGMHQTIGVVR
jgi:ABC-type lipoprotein release transport system permease subunit